MNIRRGLIRVWIVISLLYVALALTLGGSDAVSNVRTITDFWGVDESYSTPKKKIKDSSGTVAALAEALPKIWKHRARKQLMAFALITVGPPALFWVLLYAGFWVAGGFKGKQ